ncbi:MAG: VTT domain-containing protein [Caulobacteraceae bacterium]|nr:VTT domain-containing protein [Caulobacteraceae bacterium]
MNRAWRFLPIGLLAALAVAAIASGSLHELTFANLQAHHRALRLFVERHPVESMAAYLVLETLVVSACIPGPGLMSVVAGFLFGALAGGAACLAAGVAGSCIVYVACRTAFGGVLADRAGPNVARVIHALQEDGFGLLLTLRLMPVMPLMVVNVAAGLAPAPPAAFVAASALGGAPVSFLLAAIGAGLGRLFHEGVKVDASLFMRPSLLGPLVALAALSAVPVVVRLLRRRRTARAAS